MHSTPLPSEGGTVKHDSIYDAFFYTTDDFDFGTASFISKEQSFSAKLSHCTFGCLQFLLLWHLFLCWWIMHKGYAQLSLHRFLFIAIVDDTTKWVADKKKPTTIWKIKENKNKNERALSKKNAVAIAKYTVQNTIAISHLFLVAISVYS